MIRLTRLNQTQFYLNSDLVEFIEMTPDTMITTINGGKLLVAESAEEVVRRITEYQRQIHACAGPGGGGAPTERRIRNSEIADLADTPPPTEEWRERG